VEKSKEFGINVKIREQPPNSPDLNVLDLGIFRALQSCQFRNALKDVNDLIVQIKVTFNNYSPKSLDNVWLTLQMCMNEIIDHDGGNNYKIIHM